VTDSPCLSRENLEAMGMVVPEVRFEDEIARCVEADAGRPPQGGILFVGDSDIRRWDPAAMADAFAGLPVINRGFGGARTWEVLLSFNRIVLPYRPRVIVYCCGDNDIARLKENGVASAVTGFRLFADLVTTHLPATGRILYLAIHRSPSDAPLWGFIERANVGIRRVCGAAGMAEFVDYLHLLAEPDGRLREEAFMPDGLHVTPAFYRHLSAFLRPLLDAAWSAGPTASWPS